MKIFETKVIHKCYYTTYERTFSHKGKNGKHFFVSRSKGPVGIHSPNKKPDAVVVMAFYEDVEPKLVLTSEFRVPIGAREISFPAGIIEDGETPQEAAVREMFEETGLTFTPHTVSPLLYSSAGLTDESCSVVIGIATGTPSEQHLEESEDIKTMILSYSEVCKLMENKYLALSKVMWPFLWSFKVNNGFPALSSI